jgi:hypothetical protein
MRAVPVPAAQKEVLMSALSSFVSPAVRRILVLAAVLSCLSLFGCNKECDKCTSDADCASSKDAPVCRRFSNGDMRCGSGLGATTCRIP